MQPYNVKTTKRDLIARLQNHEKGKKSLPFEQKNPYNLTQKQLDDLEVTKAEVAEHSKNWEFSSTTPVKEYPTQAETEAETVYKFSTLLKDRKNKS